ncbi:exodeoxyribonuclease V subunit gamma [Limnohabitans sp. T6-5]|uniref:exodeoxyribonuclease V subunit gamma n=1 Tax=Limnohabitans sp. T6-5 TaxID=1100724 RepID=UPI000D3545E2|nr:exodeoxyribonuclease V subunit gamma [Limnohabitans sp. T6-5]PUE10824.1 exodeoxyribonuclease V subunit gamma [Limnohabitans sp. T6-5]
MTDSLIPPGFLALHSHRSEVLAETLSGWLLRQPLAPLEQEVVLVQSNGMAEWIKMALALQGGERGGVCAATKVELPSRFLWRTYRQVLGSKHVPPDSPLDKLPMTWRLMALLPQCLDDPVFAPVAGFLRGDEPDRLLQLASRLADLFDQYQIYRPDWLEDWAAGRNLLRQNAGHAELPADQLWQAQLWRRVLATLSDAERQATRPALHVRAVAHLKSGQALASPVARRVSVFGMSHMPGQLLDILDALSQHSQVLLAVPNPCQYHWGDIMDGRDALKAERRRHPYKKENLSAMPLEQMHLHAPALLAAWGRQGRDFIRQLDAFDAAQAAQELVPGIRLDLFDDAPGADATRLLTQLQNRIRDLKSSQDPVDAPLHPDDRSIVFKVAHSPVRELEVLHDQLLQWFHEQPDVSPRDVVVMVPDIESMAPAIRAVFGQYKRSDARFIPFDIADLGAQATSPLIHAVEWLLALPQQRSRMSELVELLEVPALAARFGIQPEQLPTLTRWMAGSGIRWGLSAEHRQGLGLSTCGEDNSALFGVQRMLMGYACGADPLPADASQLEPYAEVGGLDAELAGALAHLLQALIGWWQSSATPATPQLWAERGRALLAALFKAHDDTDRNALSALDQALNDWVKAADQASFEQTVPLAVVRSAWMEALKVPKLEQRFRAGGVTFCTLMPMRAIPFQRVCLLGMNDGDYPRRSPRADFDLLGLPGMARPGDRSRRDDDRQLMLEALLSARRVLYVSWSGHSVRDNSEQPPSVLVSQLRDEIDALWGQGTAKRLTTQHPLQPFSRAYFEQGSGLQTYAKEWWAAQKPLPTQGEGVHPSAQPLPAIDAAHGLPVLTLAQLHSFLRRPVAAFFRQRLLVNLQSERTELLDEELFGLNGLDLYALMDDQLNNLPPELTPDGVPAHVQAAVQRLRRAGDLPLAAVGVHEAERLRKELEPLLTSALGEMQAWPEPAPRWLVEREHPAVRLQDNLSLLRQRAQDPATGQPGIDAATGQPVVQTVFIELRASKVASITTAGKVQPLADKLIGTWLTQLAAAATGHALHAVVVGRNAVLRSPPMAPEDARVQLDAVLDVWAEGMRWPLPLPPGVALQWLKAPEKLNTLADLYEGNGWDSEGEVRKDPALYRMYPSLQELMAQGHFERLTQVVYQPLLDWVKTLKGEAMADPNGDSEDEEAA